MRKRYGEDITMLINQSGFMRERSKIEAIFCVPQLTEKHVL